MIEVKNVFKSFGEKEVLRAANLQVKDGSIFGLVGINGAGKSTLLRMLAGVLQPDDGEILLDGQHVYENEAAKRKLFFLPDDPYYTIYLTGRALADFYRTFYNFDEDVFKRYTQLYNLKANKPIRNFSKGMRRQMFISLALACKPKFLFMDEAFDGLDPLARLEFKRGLIELQEGGTSVIISSHSLRELDDICDSFALLDNQVVLSYGELDTELSKLAKFQLAFKEDLDRKDLPFACLHYEKTGSVMRVVAKGDIEEIRTRISKMNPIIYDEIPMDFEDMFIYEVEKRGYLK